MKEFLPFALAALLFNLCAPAYVRAGPPPNIRESVALCDPNSTQHCAAPDVSGNLPVTGTLTASLGGFTPSASGARMTPLTVTTSDSSGTLPTGAVVVVSNVGANPIYCNVNGIAATTSDELIPASSWFAFTIPAAITTLHCIATGSSSTADGVGGAGLATGAGGGSGGGGGGAVTIASGGVASGAYASGSIASGAFASGSIGSGAIASGAVASGAVASGAIASGACATGCIVDLGTATSPSAGTVNAQLATIATAVAAATPAGTNLIGKVGVDQTTPGTTNNVTVSTNVGALPLVQATASAAITFTAAGGPTQIIAASGSTKIYVTHIHYVVSGAGTFALITGTGTNCGTNTAYLEGASGHPLSFAANGGISAGSGLGPIYVTGAGGEICAITTGSVDTSGVISYAQF